MKKILYVVAIASLSILGFASCSESFFDTEYTSYLRAIKLQSWLKKILRFGFLYQRGVFWLVRYNISGDRRTTTCHMSVGLSLDMMGRYFHQRPPLVWLRLRTRQPRIQLPQDVGRLDDLLYGH